MTVESDDRTSWRPSGWDIPCSAELNPELTLADLSHVLLDLAQSLPTTFALYLPQIALPGDSEADRKSQPPTFGRQRDVLPSCFTSLSAEDLPKEYSDMDLLPSLPSARFAWMGLMITCITWHYGFGENGATVRPLFGPPMPTQFSSLVRRGTATDVGLGSQRLSHLLQR